MVGLQAFGKRTRRAIVWSRRETPPKPSGESMKRKGATKKLMTNPEREQSAAKGRAKSRIPTFKTIEEAAEFWDTHDSAEFEDEFEDVTNVRFVMARPKKAITVRLPEDSL